MMGTTIPIVGAIGLNQLGEIRKTGRVGVRIDPSDAELALRVAQSGTLDSDEIEKIETMAQTLGHPLQLWAQGVVQRADRLCGPL